MLSLSRWRQTRILLIGASAMGMDSSMDKDFRCETTRKRRHVTVVGAGIIGINCALQAVKSGHVVVLLDREAPGQGCSFGNAGLIARSSFVPLSSPRILAEVPKWLLDPLGPLAIRWTYLPRLIPWLVRFVRAGNLKQVHRTAAALQTLTEPSVELYQQLAKEAGVGSLVRASDYIYVFETKKAFAKAAFDMELREQLGVRVERLRGGEVRDLEPTLADHFKFAYRLLDHGFTVDPEGLVKSLADHFRRLGGDIRRCEVKDAEFGPRDVTALITDDGRLETDVVVLAAGAYSGPLARTFGVTVPLDTERGYHVTLPDPGVMPKRPVMSGERKFLVTPMAMGLRFAGTVEFGGVVAPANYARARALLALGGHMFPGIRTDGYSEWMGLRPTLPDSLPVIGSSPKFDNVIFAFGHQHIGLTAAPKTAQIIAELIDGRAPNVDIRPFRPNRF